MSKVTLKVDEGIAVLGIKRPEALNALSREIVDEIDNKVEEIKANSLIKVLVLYSEGNFAAGADIKGMVDCNEEQAASFAFSETFNKIANLKIPTIAAIAGYALGGGLEYALTCDLRIAAENAVMGFPETSLGIMPGAGGTIRAPRLVGKSKAMEMILLGTYIKSEEALSIGLINKIAQPDSLYEEALKWAHKIAKGASLAIETAKETISMGIDMSDIDKAIEIESVKWAKLFNTEDQKEGMIAFIEKRKPVYKGR